MIGFSVKISPILTLNAGRKAETQFSRSDLRSAASPRTGCKKRGRVQRFSTQALEAAQHGEARSFTPSFTTAGIAGACSRDYFGVVRHSPARSSLARER